MAQGDTSTSTADPVLELTRWGTRFTSRETEARYRVWQVEQSVPFNRAGGSIATVILLGSTYLLWAIGAFHPWGLVTAVVVLPICLMATAMTFRRSLWRWMPPMIALANTSTGWLAVGLTRSAQIPSQHRALEATLATILVASYFAFTVLRLRPMLSSLAVLPYMLFELVELVLDTQMGRVTTAAFAIDVSVLAAATASGFMVNVVLDITSRRSYRQERIIETQKETISRERAQTEAILKKELSHQVAERSRELGDALSRVQGTASVALPVAGDLFHTRYRIVRALGEGGMGAVFEVERLTDTQHFALKVLTGRMSGMAAARFAREAEIGARLQHPNLIAIVDVGLREGGAPFLVMALVHGGSLEGRRARFGEVAWGLPILRQIALGLSILHEAGVVHRDLKPSNVLLDDADPGSAVAKISDFGISRFGRLDDAGTIDPEALTVGVSTPDLTGTGAILGTPAYMAPEAARGGRSVDAAADVFAFGLLAYEVLTGHAPFPTLPVLLARAGRPLPAPASIDDPAVGTTARDAVVACLAEDPKNRPTARTVCELLGAITTT